MIPTAADGSVHRAASLKARAMLEGWNEEITTDLGHEVHRN